MAAVSTPGVAASKKKVRKLDAICAKLKLIGNDGGLVLPQNGTTCNGSVSSPTSFLLDGNSDSRPTKDTNGYTNTPTTDNVVDDDKSSPNICDKLSEKEESSLNVNKETDNADGHSEEQTCSIDNKAAVTVSESSGCTHSHLDENANNNDNCEMNDVTNTKNCDVDTPPVANKINETLSSETPSMNSSPTQSQPSSRRKRRKALTPRSIVQVQQTDFDIDEKDELAEYKINNQDTEFPPLENDQQAVLSPSNDMEVQEKESENSSANPERTNCHDMLEFKRSRKSRKPVINMPRDDHTSSEAPLDLSVCKKDTPNSSEQNAILSSDGKHEDLNTAEDLGVSTPVIQVRSAQVDEVGDSNFKKDHPEISVLKDYAESTMNELISMYGFGANHHSANLEHMHNFTSLMKPAQPQISKPWLTRSRPPKPQSTQQQSHVSRPHTNADVFSPLQQQIIRRPLLGSSALDTHTPSISSSPVTPDNTYPNSGDEQYGERLSDSGYLDDHQDDLDDVDYQDDLHGNQTKQNEGELKLQNTSFLILTTESKNIESLECC